MNTIDSTPYREDIELAAQALDLEIIWDEICKKHHLIENSQPQGWWIPQADDGQAFRLAIAMDITIVPHLDEGYVETGWKVQLQEPVSSDGVASARLAVLKTAAELQRQRLRETKPVRP